MNWDIVSPIFVALPGVFVGWMLTEMSYWLRSKREWSNRLNELKIENYAEWAAGMDANLVTYATQTSGSRIPYKTPLCEKRLLLIERDPEARRLIREVQDSIPDYGTDDYQDLREEAYTNPEWDWDPYRQRMDELLGYVRKKLS